MRRYPRPRHPWRGYTLVEVVLAIGILMALAALAFGIAGPARERARVAVCTSQMRQIGQAFAMYFADYDAIEPRVGARLQYWQVGLMPRSRANAFIMGYGIRRLIHCPSEVRPVPPGYEYIYSVPAWHLSAEAAGPEYLAAKGTRFPLVICGCHNDGKYPDEPVGVPEWHPFRLHVLRYDQSLSWTTIRADNKVTRFLL